MQINDDVISRSFPCHYRRGLNSESDKRIISSSESGEGVKYGFTVYAIQPAIDLFILSGHAVKRIIEVKGSSLRHATCYAVCSNASLRNLFYLRLKRIIVIR